MYKAKIFFLQICSIYCKKKFEGRSDMNVTLLEDVTAYNRLWGK